MWGTCVILEANVVALCMRLPNPPSTNYCAFFYIVQTAINSLLAYTIDRVTEIRPIVINDRFTVNDLLDPSLNHYSLETTPNANSRETDSLNCCHLSKRPLQQHLPTGSNHFRDIQVLSHPLICSLYALKTFRSVCDQVTEN